MNIGISGTRGFIGSCVAKTLKSKKHGVLSLDPYTEKLLLNDEKLPKDLDWVLHFAAKTKVSESFNSTYAFYANNINSTLYALEIARYSNASFLHMSSYVYGIPTYVPIDEAHPTSATNPYMGSKLACEQISLQISHLEKIPLIILRGFNIFGPGLPPGRLVSDLLQSVQTGKQLTINDPIPRRDYLYIDDFCALVIKIIETEIRENRIFNVAYGHSYSNLEVAELIRKLAGEKRPVQIKSVSRRNDILNCQPDATLVKERFSWQPEYSLEHGLEKLLQLSSRKGPDDV